MTGYTETKVTENGVEYTVKEYANGDREWRTNGKLNRVDAPAVEYADGDCFYYLDDKLNRFNGPAIEWADGTCSWYLDNNWVTKEEHAEMVKGPGNDRARPA